MSDPAASRAPNGFTPLRFGLLLALLIFALVRRDRRPPETPAEPEPTVGSDEPPP